MKLNGILEQGHRLKKEQKTEHWGMSSFGGQKHKEKLSSPRYKGKPGNTKKEKDLVKKDK